MGDAKQNRSEEEAIKECIQRVARAINTQDLELYGSSVSRDLLNMTLYGSGQDVVSTFGRKARQDELRTLFGNSGVTRHAAMTPLEIHISGDRAYVHVDGTLTFTPQDDSGRGTRHRLDIYMFYLQDPAEGWQTERSMAVVRDTIEL